MNLARIVRRLSLQTLITTETKKDTAQEKEFFSPWAPLRRLLLPGAKEFILCPPSAQLSKQPILS
jgi:hypothetical protein